MLMPTYYLPWHKQKLSDGHGPSLKNSSYFPVHLRLQSGASVRSSRFEYEFKNLYRVAFGDHQPGRLDCQVFGGPSGSLRFMPVVLRYRLDIAQIYRVLYHNRSMSVTRLV